MADSATDLISTQHDHLTDLFDRVSSPDEDRPKVLTELLQELAAHVSVERSVLYPVLHESSIGDDSLSEHLKEYHDEIERLLILVERRKYNSPDVPGMVTEMKDLTERHVSISNDSILPAIAATLTAEEQADLAERMDSAEATILTHPHPHLMSLGPISRVATRLAARFDEARDRTANPQHAEIDRRPGD